MKATAEKEKQIAEKKERIAKLQEDFEEKMRGLRDQYNVENDKKVKIDQELHEAKDELENLEERFPHEVSQLRMKIDTAKQQTNAHEKATKEL